MSYNNATTQTLYFSDNGPDYKSLNEWEKSLKKLKPGNMEVVEFTHEKFNGERKKRKVTIKEILVSGKAQVYFKGYCHTRNAIRTFNIGGITSKIKIGTHQFDVYDFLDSFYGIEIN